MSHKPQPVIRYAMSRRRRSILISLAMLFFAGLAALDHSCASRSLNAPAKTVAEQDSRDTTKYHGRQFTVIYVVDGDTLDIDVPDVNRASTRIRLWGVDTPETKKPGAPIMYFGPEAAEFARASAINKKVTIYLDPQRRNRDKYGRLLAYVQLADRSFLNELLLSEGYAYADVRFEHVNYHKYQQLESSARAAKKGLWKDVTREQLPQWLQDRKPNLLSGK